MPRKRQLEMFGGVPLDEFAAPDAALLRRYQGKGPKKPVLVPFPVELMDALDAASESAGLSRTAFVVWAVESAVVL